MPVVGYNEPLHYNAALPYDGQCLPVAPPQPMPGGGGGLLWGPLWPSAAPLQARRVDDEEILLLLLL